MLAPYCDKLTFERAHELLVYEPDTGLLRWRVTLPGHRREGKVAGSHKPKRIYACVRLDDILYQQHRVIWLMMTGAWPTLDIDHRDEDKRNNRWSNLREASRLRNIHNRAAARRDSTSGIRGVSLRNNRWRAIASVGGKNISIGTFDSAPEAKTAYDAFIRQRLEKAA